MDDISIVEYAFVDYLQNLNNSLKQCEEFNLIFNEEKCHFIVKEGIVL